MEHTAGYTRTILLPDSLEKRKCFAKLVEAAKTGSNEMKMISELAEGPSGFARPPKTVDVQFVASNEPKVNLKKIMDKQGQVVK